MAFVRELKAMLLVAAGLTAVACAPKPKFGPVGETPAVPARITAVDSAIPPNNLSIQLEQQAYAAVLLVAPGHSATLLYPVDSTTNNRLTAGAHVLPVTVPDHLIPLDSARLAALIARARDTTSRVRQRPSVSRVPPILSTTPTFLFVITSPQELSFQRITAKTTGVSIPVQDLEALNAVGKAVKSTLLAEPRVWHGYYQQVEIKKPGS